MTDTAQKIAIIGPVGCGKSNLIRQYLCENIPLTYKPTLGVAVHCITHNNITHNVWDCAGINGGYSGLREGYVMKANHIIIFDTPSHSSRYREYIAAAPHAKITYTDGSQPLANLF